MQLTPDQIKKITGKLCPYCGAVPEYIDSSYVYGKSYGMIWICKPCDAYCGVHKGTNKPLGRLANKPLRELKKKAHSYFDPVWQSGTMTRHEAYKWLAGFVGVPKQYAHIGMFGEETCRKIISHLLTHHYYELKQ